MIDILNESLLTLAEAARLLPKRRAGKPAHISCIYRWTTVGCRGVILESLQCGGTRCTSREALARFFEALTHNDSRRADRTPGQRERAAVAAERELERQGI